MSLNVSSLSRLHRSLNAGMLFYLL
uniref:Uncharacterized protein n=1 Tax=Anguilla anguilla TaxID=7936 RepID=A0A0E9RBY2_ANGAN